ncbi:MAG: lipoprotein signal peptidase [Deltaproteobacteria bacterium]|nr:lipoprotein signal peptidase [Deltaproteobacteria bacterium]
MEKKTVLICLIVGSILVLDQATKWLVASRLRVHESVTVIESFFQLTHARNTGAAFSLLAQAPASFRQPFFFVTTLIAVGVLLVLLRRVEPSRTLTLVAIAGILGGALGNFIDRLLYGEVIDFLLVHWRQYYWPAFNVADSCITVGVALLLFASFREPQET